MIATVDPLVQSSALLAVVSIFIGYLVKTGARRATERAKSEKLHAEERVAVAKERVAVQENFKDYLTSQSTSWAKTQGKIAESLTLLSTEIHTMSVKNSAEHSWILDWVQDQKNKESRQEGLE